MAHELTIRADGYTEMAFVGSTPWHGLGQELKQDATIEEWRVAAGMDWTIKSAPVEFQDETGWAHDFEGQNVLYRSDTNAPLSVVSNRYKTVQPHDVLEFFRDLVEESGFRLHTAGTLFGGRRLWALAETGRFAEVTEGDGIGGFLLLSTSADKSLATTARFTSIRVVCNNTLTMALGQRSNRFTMPHVRIFDQDVAQRASQALGLASGQLDAFKVTSELLARVAYDEKQVSKYITQLFQPALIAEHEDRSLWAKTADEVYNCIHTQPGAKMSEGTWWSALNAVTYYVDQINKCI